MTTLAELKELAEKTTPGPWFVKPRSTSDASFIAACSPDVILRLLAVIEAADAMRETFINWSDRREVNAYDAARAALK